MGKERKWALQVQEEGEKSWGLWGVGVRDRQRAGTLYGRCHQILGEETNFRDEGGASERGEGQGEGGDKGKEKRGGKERQGKRKGGKVSGGEEWTPKEKK